MKRTWVWALNYFVLQWVGVRLCRVIEDDGKQSGWTWKTRVVPMSGWGTPYRKF